MVVSDAERLLRDARAHHRQVTLLAAVYVILVCGAVLFLNRKGDFRHPTWWFYAFLDVLRMAAGGLFSIAGVIALIRVKMTRRKHGRLQVKAWWRMFVLTSMKFPKHRFVAASVGALVIALPLTAAWVVVQGNSFLFQKMLWFQRTVVPGAQLALAFLLFRVATSEPPDILYLGASTAQGFVTFLRLREASHANMEQRTVTLIDMSRAHDTEFTSDLSHYSHGLDVDVLRTYDSAQWRESVAELMSLAGVIIMDAREHTSNTSEELSWLVSRGLLRKTLMVVDAGSQHNPVSRRALIELSARPNQVVSEDAAVEWARRVRPARR